MDRWLVERDLHCALNSFWGCPDPTLQEQHQADDRPAVSRILRGLANDVARLKEVKEVTESFDWGDFFRTRTLVLRAQQHNHTRDTEKCEIRKDKVLPTGSTVWRVYLDNYDLREKYPRETLLEEAGESAPEVEALRKEYLEWGLPRHPKKGVSRQVMAEVQGAVVDGRRGLAYPKMQKLSKYVTIAHQLIYYARDLCNAAPNASGVYFSTFRRQLLGGLKLELH